MYNVIRLSIITSIVQVFGREYRGGIGRSTWMDFIQIAQRGSHAWDQNATMLLREYHVGLTSCTDLARKDRH
jgi:hypothetical protein